MDSETNDREQSITFQNISIIVAKQHIKFTVLLIGIADSEDIVIRSLQWLLLDPFNNPIEQFSVSSKNVTP